MRGPSLMFGIFALALGASLPAHANEKAKTEPHVEAKPGEAKDAEKKPADKGGMFHSADNIVPLPVLIAPVIAHDRLVTHLYMFLAAVTASAGDAAKLKERIPQVLDAMVLTVYHDLTVTTSRDVEPDYDKLIAGLKASINQTMGREIVTEIKVGKIDTAPY
jgi:hypothetical protein